MIELRRCLTDRESVLSRLFHFEMKDLIKHGLSLMDKLPSPGVNLGDLETQNARQLIAIRDELVSHAEEYHSGPIIRQAMNFIILLYDSDEAWRRMIFRAIEIVKRTEFVPEPKCRPEYWRE